MLLTFHLYISDKAFASLFAKNVTAIWRKKQLEIAAKSGPPTAGQTVPTTFANQIGPSTSVTQPGPTTTASQRGPTVIAVQQGLRTAASQGGKVFHFNSSILCLISGVRY